MHIVSSPVDLLIELEEVPGWKVGRILERVGAIAEKETERVCSIPFSG